MYIPKVLIVDDEEADRETLRTLLLPENYELFCACNGAEGLAKAGQIKPDLIFLDVMMPYMDGFEVCQRVRNDPILAEVAIIMVTSLDDRASRLRGIEVGADDFVAKPFDRIELRARARAVIRINRYQRLLAERSKFEWVVNRAQDGYLIVDNADRIIYANVQARLYLSLAVDAAEPLSATFTTLIQKRYRQEPPQAWIDWRTAPNVATSPRYLVRPESATAKALWLQVDALELPIGAERNWMIHLRDVTNQVLLQRDMHGFHRVVKHKLRTPLGGILGTFELLQGFDTMSQDEIAELVEMGLYSARRLCSEIEDILRYTDALDYTSTEARFSLAQLPPLVTKLCANLNLDAVTVNCPPGVSTERIPLSYQALELILGELLENAARFHPTHQPTVELTVAKVNADKLSLQIEDDGQTLPPEQLDKVWLPYYQGEKSFTGEVPGMGLGLAMVAALVWGVGGACRIYNRVDGAGVVVELVIPLAGK